jgi:hypothetical protein
LLHERPERGVGGVQHAAHNIVAILGLVEVEDYSK